MTDDALTAALDEIRAEVVQFALPKWSAVPRLLAAVEAVLARHVPKPRTTVHPCSEHSIFAPLGELVGPGTRNNCPDCRFVETTACAACDPICPDDNMWPCEDVQAISRALLGEDANVT